MQHKIEKKELRLYIASGLVAIVGVVFLILGIVGSHLSPRSDLYKIQENFSWRYIGLIIIAASVIFALIVLLYFAKKVDRISDRELRRKQRLSAMMQNDESEKFVVSDGKVVQKQEKKVEEDHTVELQAAETEQKTTDIQINQDNNNEVK